MFQFIYELFLSLICWFQSMSNILDGPPLSLFPKFTCILVLFLSDFHTFIFALSFCYKVVVCMSLKLKLPPWFQFEGLTLNPKWSLDPFVPILDALLNFSVTLLDSTSLCKYTNLHDLYCFSFPYIKSCSYFLHHFALRICCSTSLKQNLPWPCSKFEGLKFKCKPS